MQRFFFHFASPDETVRDRRGVVLSDLAAAHGHAMKLVRELVPVLPEAERRKWRIEIGHGGSRPPVTVLFPVSTLMLGQAAAPMEPASAPSGQDPSRTPGLPAAALGRRC